MNKVTKISQNCIDLIVHYECGDDINKYLKAYKCPAGVWTIGIGTTVYPNGFKVKKGDIITLEQSYLYLNNDLKTIAEKVDSFTTDKVNQQQFDSLCSFAYNLGTNALKSSTLLKKININPNDTTIQGEYCKWVYAAGLILPGLVRRRLSEAFLYFNGILKYDF